MQHARHVVVVVPDAEALRDQVADHRAGPDAAGVSGGMRSRLDQRRQLVPLRVTQLGDRSWGDRGDQPVHTERFVPLQPPIDRPARDIEFCRQVHDASPFDISEHPAGAPPDVEVIAAPGLVEKSS